MDSYLLSMMRQQSVATHQDRYLRALPIPRMCSLLDYKHLIVVVYQIGNKEVLSPTILGVWKVNLESLKLFSHWCTGLNYSVHGSIGTQSTRFNIVDLSISDLAMDILTKSRVILHFSHIEHSEIIPVISTNSKIKIYAIYPRSLSNRNGVTYLRDAICQAYANCHVSSHTDSMNQIQNRNVAKITTICTRFKLWRQLSKKSSEY